MATPTKLLDNDGSATHLMDEMVSQSKQKKSIPRLFWAKKIIKNAKSMHYFLFFDTSMEKNCFLCGRKTSYQKIV